MTRSPQRSGTRSGSTRPAPPRTPPPISGRWRAPIRPPPPMPPGPPPTPCTWPPPRWAAASCARPPTPTTAPPAPPTPASPSPTPAGNQLRRTARLITAFAYLTKDPALTPIVLITRLAALAEAVIGLRQAQQHAAQAAGALHAARQLHAAAGTPADGTARQPARTHSPAALAGASFPQPPRPLPPDSPASGPRRPAAHAPAPSSHRRR